MLLHSPALNHATPSSEAVETLEEAVRRLVQHLAPERIYLFGSLSRAEATPDSDIDLLVIVSESSLPRHRREALAYQSLWGMTAPIDVIVMTREEFQRGQQVSTSLPSTVIREGILLYERSKNG
ncbi:MAG TPA: nucleotidyltransferase domain-containing protein [Anaerolineae bacterium]|nr:nucleotidyltransferase domain-containing protein [Anaerolineae bacterium]